LTPQVKIPFHPMVIKNKEKIFPSMLGPGGKTYNIFSHQSLAGAYNNLFIKSPAKTKKLMCYFGGNVGPRPIFSYQPDLYQSESEILGFYYNLVDHPNEKRAIAADMIKELGPLFDARVIKTTNKKTGEIVFNKDLFIPLSNYTEHISKFEYNLNISGFRKSIPNRFIYSFCVGTAIVTDKLSVKWFLPFEEEVVETTEMGYLPSDEVNWEAFKDSISKLPGVSTEKIMENFQKKWSPKAFAKYVVETCVNQINNTK
jgi:hypothetical protein